MKTSNIILVSVIASFMLTPIIGGLLQNRFLNKSKSETQGSPETQDSPEVLLNYIELPDYKYLVIEDQKDITIETSVDNQLILKNEEGFPTPKVDYHVNRDTLFIDDISKSAENKYPIIIHTPLKDVGWIEGRNSDFKISNISAGKLFLKLDDSKVVISNSAEKKIRDLTIYGSNGSRINSNSFQVDDLVIHLDHSNASIPVSIENLSGSLVNGSKLYVKEVNHFDFTKDKSSKFTHHN